MKQGELAVYRQKIKGNPDYYHTLMLFLKHGDTSTKAKESYLNPFMSIN